MKLFRLYGSQDYISLYYKNRDLGKNMLVNLLEPHFMMNGKSAKQKCDLKVNGGIKK